jgi:hypothetical protein
MPLRLNAEKRKYEKFARSVSHVSTDPEVVASMFMDSRFWPPRRGRPTPLERVADGLVKNGFIHGAVLPDLRGLVKTAPATRGKK